MALNVPFGGLDSPPQRPRNPERALRATKTPDGSGLVTGQGQTANPFPNDKPIGAVTTQRVVDPTQFQQFQAQSGNLESGDSALLIPEPTSSRCYLNIRVTAGSKGSLAVSPNQKPATADQSSWIINPGEEKEFIVRVPQNRMYGFADNGAVSYVVTYANIAEAMG